jgi:tetratricopeptide (TPR) repeat protein
MSDTFRTWLGACVIVLVGAATYANSLSGRMLLDDQSAIVLNPQIRHLWPLTEALAAPRNNELESRPLVNLSFAINYAIGELSVRGYHLVNVSLHIASALLLFGIIRRTLAAGALRDRFATASDGIALASALIWMVHPLQTEPVDYLTQRTELLMGLFYLSTLYCAIRAARATAPERWHAAAIIACLLGMGSKESMVTAPAIVLLYDRVFVFDSLRDAWRSRKTLYAGFALAWLALAALLLTSHPATVGFASGASPWTYLLNQALMVVRYLKLAVWPFGLVIDYGLPRALVLSDILPQALLIVALLVLTGIALVRQPALGFLGAWFFITLAPASSFVPIATEVGAERRMYLPLAAVVVLAAIGVRHLLAKAGGRRAASIAVVVASLVVAALAMVTKQRNRDYNDPAALLQASVARWPQGRAHFNLAFYLQEAGRPDEAMAHLRAAVPDYPPAQFEVGSDLYNRGRFDEAIAQLRTFVGRLGQGPLSTKRRVMAANLIALSLARQGRVPQAIDEFHAGLQLDPDNAALHGNLALILQQQRDFEGARQHYEAYLAHQQGTAFVLTNLGMALQELGRVGEAEIRFRQALALDPNDPDARRGLDQIVRFKR